MSVSVCVCLCVCSTAAASAAPTADVTATALLAVCCRQVQVVGRVGEEAAGDGRGPLARRDALQPDLVHGDDARQQERGSPQGSAVAWQVPHRPRVQPRTQPAA